MPLQRKEGPDGPYWVRPPFRQEDYVVPQRELDSFASWRTDMYSTEELLTLRDGPFVNYDEVSRSQRDGKTFVLLRQRAHDYCIEVELGGRGVGNVVPVAPQRAYDIAREQDRSAKVKIVQGP